MIQACNNFVFIVRDAAEKERGGLIIPGVGQEKPHRGTIHSVGDMVQDKNIKKSKGKKCIFHKTVGWELEHDGVKYLVLEGHQIIGLV